MCSARPALLISDVMPSEKLIVLLYCEDLYATWQILKSRFGCFRRSLRLFQKMQWCLNPRSAIEI
ncbi:MAG TPA: hypothetical protein DCM70_04890 [Rhodobacteraceae bacterium]|nr:hypothetical protein [Paracoccaceae bacterium]